MKKRIEKYFPAALEAIKTVLQDNNPVIVIDREYQAYIASFGASVLQMGLLPTLAVYADQESGAAKDRRRLLQVLSLTMMAENGKFLSEPVKNALKGKERELFQVAVYHEPLRKELTDRILDAAVAVKLCLRTFNLTKL